VREPITETFTVATLGEAIDMIVDLKREIIRLRRKLEIAREYLVRIQHEGDGHSHWIASAALGEIKKEGES
jgi:hypothetical protein